MSVSGISRGPYLPTASAIALICSGVEPLAAADDVEQAFPGELFELGRHGLRALIILAWNSSGQARIRIGADERIRYACDLGQMVAHGIGAERAIEADRERLCVANRVPECRRSLDLESVRPERSVIVPEIDHR